MRLPRLAAAFLTAGLALAPLTAVSPAATAAGPAPAAGVTVPEIGLTCPSRAELRAARGVVLLVPGTGSRPDEAFGWGYQPALNADGFATCTVALPDDGLGPFVAAADRVRTAIKRTARLAGRRISVVGHSQGGALPVWDVKFFPRVAAKVDDVISLAGPFGGTQLGNELCLLQRCAPLAWQLRVGARHVQAMRNAPTPGGVSITSLAGAYDEIVRPQPAASTLPGATNILLTDICAHDPSEHGLILGDPLGYRLTVDALTHPGPAVPSRLPADTCSQVIIPHFDPVKAPTFLVSVARFLTGLSNPTRWVGAEPALPAYAEPFAR